MSRHLNLKIAVACAAFGWLCWSVGSVSNAQTAGAAGLSPDLQEVVKLSQAKMPDDVIKNYIINSGKTYRLSVDDIIYLNNQGVSSSVITTLQTAGSAAPSVPVPTTPPPVAPVPTTPPQVMPVATTPASMPVQTAPVPQPTTPAPAIYANTPPPGAGIAPAVVQSAPPPPPDVNFQYFHDQLAPFGAWINVNGVMYWRPDQAMAVNPDWRPYYDMGQWVQTDNGLYWQSDYTWGDIPFHYGRWVLYPGMGWLWAPDYTWGPAWVFWRQDEADGAIGWAPLPVGAVYVNGGFFYHGVAVGVNFDFGLGVTCFTFVGCEHFHEPYFRMRGHEWAYHIDHARMHDFYGRSVIRNDFHRDEHGRFVNDGIGRDRMEHLTHVQHASFEERNPVGDRNHLAAAHAEEFHGKPMGEPAHAQPGNPGGARPAGPGGENGASHQPSLGNQHSALGAPVSKVYRPPNQNGSQSQQSQQSQRQKKP
jgi:hypothetical protein